MALQSMKKMDPEEELAKAKELLKKSPRPDMSKYVAKKREQFIAKLPEEETGEPVRQKAEEWDSALRARNARARAAFHDAEIKRVDDYISKRPIGEGNAAYNFLAAQRKDAAMKKRKEEGEAAFAADAASKERRGKLKKKEAPTGYDPKKDVKVPERSSLESPEDIDYSFRQKQGQAYGRGHYIKEGSYEDNIPFAKKDNKK